MFTVDMNSPYSAYVAVVCAQSFAIVRVPHINDVILGGGEK